MTRKLPTSFYQRIETLQICEELLGKMLVTNLRCALTQRIIQTGGLIIELEAYCAPEDKASHAYNYRRTKRTETMYSSGGVAYVYLCYGIHNLFNIVTGPKDFPHAILIRAIKPMLGIEHIMQRRKTTQKLPQILSGPGVVTTALGITTQHDQTKLNGREIYIIDHDININKKEIISTPRIGIHYAEEYVHKPWRFLVNI